MLQHNTKSTAGPKGPNTKGAPSTGNLQRVSTGPQDTTSTTTEAQKKLKGRSVAEILYPGGGKTNPKG